MVAVARAPRVQYATAWPRQISRRFTMCCRFGMPASPAPARPSPSFPIAISIPLISRISAPCLDCLRSNLRGLTPPVNQLRSRDSGRAPMPPQERRRVRSGARHAVVWRSRSRSRNQSGNFGEPALHSVGTSRRSTSSITAEVTRENHRLQLRRMRVLPRHRRKCVLRRQPHGKGLVANGNKRQRKGSPSSSPPVTMAQRLRLHLLRKYRSSGSP